MATGAGSRDVWRAVLVCLFLAGFASGAPAQDCVDLKCLAGPVWYRVIINGKPAGDSLGVRVPERSGIWLESDFVDGDAVLSRFVRLVRLVDGASFASLDAMSELRYSVHEAAELHIRVPVRYLRAQTLGPATEPPPVAFDRGTGVRLAYDAFASQQLSRNADPNLSLYLDGTWFHPRGSLRNTALLSSGQSTQAVRLDTAWEQEWFAQGVFTVLGDHVGPPDAFGRQPRRGGFSIRRAFEFDPQRIRYPLPLLAGSTELPATVDLYVDNVRRESYSVDGGPFTLTRPPVLSGAGTAQLVVTNILGEEVVYEQPFFVAPQLLNPGVWDFEVSAGAQRDEYAVSSFDYGTFAGTLNWRYGLSSQWTTDGSLLAGPGVGILELGTAGIPLATVPLRTDGGLGAYRLASGESGVLARAGLSWQSRSWFADVAHRQAIPAREVAGDSQLPYRRRQLARLGVRWGTTAFAINYIRRDRPQQDRFRQWILRASWRPRPGRWGQLTSELFRTETGAEEPADTGIRVNWIWSPQPRQQSLAYVEDDARGGWQYQWMRKGDLGAQSSVQGRYEGDGQTYFAGDYDLQTSFVGARARAVSSSSGDQLSAGVRGTVGWIGGTALLGRDPGQAFALVDINGLSGVTIFRDNQPVAVTNAEGVALVPGLRPYQANRIHLDPVDIPLDWRLPQAQVTVRPGANTGVVVPFDTAPERSAALRLFLRPGVPVPAGAEVRQPDGRLSGYTGAEGRVYVSGLSAGANVLDVEWSQGGCSFRLDWPDAEDAPLQAVLGDTLCR